MKAKKVTFNTKHENILKPEPLVINHASEIYKRDKIPPISKAERFKETKKDKDLPYSTKTNEFFGSDFKASP